MPAKFRHVFLLLLAALLFGGTAYTQEQDEGLQSEEVDVIREYKPMLADANKQYFRPELPQDERGQIPELSYQAPLRFLSIPYEAPTLRPLALSQPDPPPLKHIYAKAGFGSQITPLLEAVYSSGRSEKGSFGFNARYTSSNGRRENQILSEADAGAFGKLFFSGQTAGLNLDYRNRVFHYYGYDDEDTSFNREDVKQRFGLFQADLRLENHEENDVGINYNTLLSIKRMADINDFNEINPLLDFTGTKRISEYDGIRLGLIGEYIGYNGPADTSRYIFRFRPSYQLRREGWYFQGGFEFAVDNGDVYLFPDLEFRKNLLENKAVFYLGWKKTLEKNTFQTLTAENPFLRDSLRFSNSRLEKRYVGFMGSINTFYYDLRFSQKPVNNMPLFVNDTLDPRRFDILYDDVNFIEFHTELGYEWPGLFQLSAAMDIINYLSLDEEEKPWHRPTFLLEIGGTYHVNEQLRVSAEILSIGKRFARLNGGEIEDINGTVDINLHAVYDYSPSFSIFLDVKNMAGIRYQQWYNYPSFGFQILGGLSFNL